MNRGNISNVIKLLTFAAGVILACILVAIGFYIGRSGKSYVNNGSNQYAKMMSDYDNLDITMYDELEVPGKELRTFIDRFPEESVDIVVYTAQNKQNAIDGKTNPADLSKTYKYASHELDENKLSPNYINPIATFVGKVSRNENGVIYLIEFTQK